MKIKIFPLFIFTFLLFNLFLISGKLIGPPPSLIINNSYFINQTGTNGTNGTNGINGLNGTNGTNGLNGTNGINGLNGTNSINNTNWDNNYTAFLNKINWVDINNGTLTTWLQLGNGTLATTGSIWNSLGNGTMVTYSTLNNGTYPTWNTITNGTLALSSTLNNGSFFNIPETDSLAYNGTLASWLGLGNGTIVFSSTLNNGTYGNYPYTNFTTVNLSTTNFNVYNKTIFLIPLKNNTNYSINCVLLTHSSLMTIGVQYNISLPNNSFKIFSGNWFSVDNSGQSLSKTCLNSSLNFCTTTPTSNQMLGGVSYFNGFVSLINSDSLNLTMKADKTGGSVITGIGSYCKLTNANLGNT